MSGTAALSTVRVSVLRPSSALSVKLFRINKIHISPLLECSWRAEKAKRIYALRITIITDDTFTVQASWCGAKTDEQKAKSKHMARKQRPDTPDGNEREY